MTSAFQNDRHLARPSARESLRPARAARAVSDVAHHAFMLPPLPSKSPYWALLA